MFPYLIFPNEICNHICSYIESPTSKIMKELTTHFEPFECLKLNKKYNFKHILIERLQISINTKCSHCLNVLNADEYVCKKIFESCFSIQLCKDCSEKNKFRVIFETCELFMIFCIFIHVWVTTACVMTILQIK